MALPLPSLPNRSCTRHNNQAWVFDELVHMFICRSCKNQHIDIDDKNAITYEKAVRLGYYTP